MDTDLTPVDERDDEEFEEARLPCQPVSVQDGKPVTIVAEGLSKYFKHTGRLIKAVDEANFTFTESQFITITGPSGSGKSTLLYILSGLDKATKGELQVDGVDVRRLSGRKENRFRRQRMGFVFQSFHLLPNLTALENVMLPMQLLCGTSPEEMRERARVLLFQVGINQTPPTPTPPKLPFVNQHPLSFPTALHHV